MSAPVDRPDATGAGHGWGQVEGRLRRMVEDPDAPGRAGVRAGRAAAKRSGLANTVATTRDERCATDAARSVHGSAASLRSRSIVHASSATPTATAGVNPSLRTPRPFHPR